MYAMKAVITMLYVRRKAKRVTLPSKQRSHWAYQLPPAIEGIMSTCITTKGIVSSTKLVPVGVTLPRPDTVEEIDASLVDNIHK